MGTGGTLPGNADVGVCGQLGSSCPVRCAGANVWWTPPQRLHSGASGDGVAVAGAVHAAVVRCTPAIGRAHGHIVNLKAVHGVLPVAPCFAARATQRVDHFNPQDTRTFQQQYWVNDEYVAGSSATCVHAVACEKSVPICVWTGSGRPPMGPCS